MFQPVAKITKNCLQKNFTPFAKGMICFDDKKKFMRNYSNRSSDMPIILGETATSIGLSPTTTIGLGTTVGLGTLAWIASRYKIAGPNEYIVRTGIFIDDIDISRRAFWLPYQTFSQINMEPTTYHCTVEEAMSHERISFNMPTVFTIGPKDDLNYLKRYAKLFQTTTAEDLRTKILGVIQGEIRVAAGKIALDDIFNNRQQFKQTLIDSVDSELSQFGLTVYNANIEELRDMAGNEYFVFLRKRALEGAVNNAKIAVAEQNKLGNVGEKKHVTETRQATAEYEKQATLSENDRTREIVESTTALDIAKIDFSKKKAIAEAEAMAAAEMKKLELQKAVEISRSLQQIEELRAKDLSSANVVAEVKVRASEGVANSKIIEAEAVARAVKIEAEAKAYATRLQAEADADARKAQAIAHLVEKENEAKGILVLRSAEADGLTNLITSAGGVDQLNSYLMVRDDMITKIAKQQSDAVRGMNPTITVVQSDGNMNGLSGSVHDVLRTGIPLLENLKSSTGLDLLRPFRDDDHNKTKLT